MTLYSLLKSEKLLRKLLANWEMFEMMYDNLAFTNMEEAVALRYDVVTAVLKAFTVCTRIQQENITCLMEGMTVKEIACLRGCSENTVRQSISEFMKHIEKSLGS